MNRKVIVKKRKQGIKILFLLFSFFVYSLSLKSQVSSKVFPEKIIKVLDIHLSEKEPKLRSQNKIILIINSLGNYNFSPGQEYSSLNILSLMKKRNMDIQPFIEYYLRGLKLFKIKKRPAEEIELWNRQVALLIRKKSTTPLLQFLTFTINFLEKGILFQRSSSSWFARGGDFNISFDSLFQIHFKNITLLKKSKNDSSVIQHTNGDYVYKRKLWKGELGIFYWQRFKLPTKMVYASLKRYRILLSQNMFRLDSVYFTGKPFFKKPVLGVVEDRVFSGPPGKRVSYPRFKSYSNFVVLNRPVPNVYYRGAVAWVGANFMGVEKGGEKGLLLIKRKKRIALKLRSSLFLFSEKKVTSPSASMVIPMAGDSLFHPQMLFKYIIKKKDITLSNPFGNPLSMPLFDSYHQMDLYVPALFWHLSSDSLIFRNLNKYNIVEHARFESSRYFSAKDFYELQGMDDLNPLYVLYNYSKTFGQRNVSANTLSGFMKIAVEQANDLLMQLSKRGFVIYDTENREAYIKNRLFNYLAAKSGKKDYDLFHFVSKGKNGIFATLNLHSLNLDIFGVPRVFISERNDVTVFPNNKEIALQKNRNFYFQGNVKTGLFKFYTKKGFFVYDSFLIKMPYIDSLTFNVKIPVDKSRYREIKVKNVLQKLSGTLFIDLPFNKSGQMANPPFPYFKSDSAAYVFFNGVNFISGENPFYYRVKPFKLDSMLHTDTRKINFPGTLFSAGIFAPLHPMLSIQSDFSLGFRFKTPSNGFPVYDGKARFTDSLYLNAAGFYGKGKLDYLTLSLNAKKVVFNLYSMVADSASSLKGKADSAKYNFPSITTDSLSVFWDTKKDIFHLKNRNRSFVVYDSSVFNGMISINPGFFKGTGRFQFQNAQIESKYFRFNYSGLKADSSVFYLTAKNNKDTAFLVNNYFVNINFSTKKGNFQRLDRYSYFRFPYNGFITTLERAQWIMDKHNVALTSPKVPKLFQKALVSDSAIIRFNGSGPKLIGIAKESKGLNFYAKQANYHIDNNVLSVSGVPTIKVADIAIFPNGGKVEIVKNGRLLPVSGKIIMDTVHFYHYLNRVKAEIFSHQKVEGKGIWYYTDKNYKRQSVVMDTIFSTTAGHVIAKGRVKPQEIFFLSPEYFFTGEITVISNKKYAFFDGGLQLITDCLGAIPPKIAFKDTLNPNNLIFDFNRKMKTLHGKPVYAGLVFQPQQLRFYPVFGQTLKKTYDEVIFYADGKLRYLPLSSSFVISTQKRKNNFTLKTNYTVLNPGKCTFSGGGLLLSQKKAGYFSFEGIGTYLYQKIPDSLKLDLSLLVKFNFNKEALRLMGDSINLWMSPSVSVENSNFLPVLKRLLSTKGYQHAFNQITTFGQLKKRPSVLKSTLTLVDLKMTWNDELHSFISSGLYGVESAGSVSLNKKVKGIVQLEKKRNRFFMNIWLKNDSGQWYYFYYGDGVLLARSSDENFNTAIIKTKKRKRQWKLNDRKYHYEYDIASKIKLSLFLDGMKKAGYKPL